MSITYQYSVPDIVCGNCSNTVEKALREAPFLKEQQLGVDPVEKILTITFEEEAASYLEMRDVINEILDPVGFSCIEMTDYQVRKKEQFFSHRTKGAIGIGFGVLFLGLSMFTLTPWMMMAMTLSSLPLTVLLGLESYEKAWKKLKKGLLTMDSLFALSTLSIMLFSVASLIFPTLPMMCEASVLILGFRHIGLAIEEAFKSTSWVTKRFQDDAPSTVIRIDERGDAVRVPLKSIQKKEVLLISPGDILAVDGVFEEDDGMILDRIVTGSHMPRRIAKGEQLYAGTVLSDANKPLRYVATSAALNSHLARLDAKIAHAKLEKASIESSTTRILQYFIPGVLGVAIFSMIVISAFFSLPLGIQSAVAVLVSACPCTLGLITPLAVKVGIKKAADSGVIFNSAKKLELADTVDCVVFDLNGTLTEGQPEVVKYGALSGSELPSSVVLQLMGHFEEKCLHPVAVAIRAAVHAENQEKLSKYEVKSNDYGGRVVDYQGARYVLGSESLLVRQGIKQSDIKSLRKKLELEHGQSLVYFAKNAQLIGYVVLRDKLRKDAKWVIQSLKKLNKRIYLCTGADTETAYEYAKKLGIPKEDVRAACVSHANTDSVFSKKKVIDDLHHQGLCVAAVGDSANDAEMIAAADVGFAIFSATDAHTQQHAAAVVQGKSLQPVLNAFTIAKQTVTNIKENLWFSVLYNTATVCLAGGLLLSVGIVLNPAVGAALMILQTSLIFTNVYRFAKASVPTVERNLLMSPVSPVSSSSLHTKVLPEVLHPDCRPQPSQIKARTSAASLFSKKKLPAHQDTDVLSVGDGVRLTYPQA